MRYKLQPVKIPENTTLPFVIPVFADLGINPKITMDIDLGNNVTQKSPLISPRKTWVDGKITQLSFDLPPNANGNSLDNYILYIQP